MKHSSRNNYSYQAKRIKKIIDSQVKILTDLVETALNKGKHLKDSESTGECVVYQDEMYRVRLTVQADADGMLRPVGHGKIDCVGDGDDDYMKFCYDTHSRLSSYLNFQWGRSKGEIYFEAGKPAGSAEVIEAVDTKFVKRSHVFIPKTIGALLALASCIGLGEAKADQVSHIGSHQSMITYDSAVHNR